MDVYELITSTLVREAQLRGRVVYGVAGNPSVLEDTTKLLRKRAESGAVQIKIVPGMSFLDLIYSELGLDPGVGLQILLPRRHLSGSLFRTDVGLIIGQVMVQSSPIDDQPNLEFVQECLLKEFPHDHLVTLIWPVLPDYRIESKTIALGDLANQLTDKQFLASLYVPPREPT